MTSGTINGYQQPPNYTQQGPKSVMQDTRSHSTRSHYDSGPTPPVITTLTRTDESRIDAMMIPRPMNHFRNEQLAEPGGQRMPANYSGQLPSSNTVCTYVEESDATPRFLRQSLGLLPQNRHALSLCKVPYSLLVTPFPRLGMLECPVPRIDLSPYSNVFTVLAAPTWGPQQPHRPGPLRCTSCGAYVNSYFQFAVQAASCNMCNYSFDLPVWYTQLLEEHRRQIPSDLALKEALYSCSNLADALPRLESPWVRAEILKGTVDYLTHAHPSGMYNMGAGYEGQQYSQPIDPPKAVPLLVYVLDVSALALGNKLPETVLGNLVYLYQAWPQTPLDIAVLLAGSEEVYVLPVDPDDGSVRAVQVVADAQNPFLSDWPSHITLRVQSREKLEAYISSIKAFIASETSCARHTNACAAALSVAVDLISARNKLAGHPTLANGLPVVHTSSRGTILLGSSPPGGPSSAPSSALPSDTEGCRIFGRGGIIQLFTTSRPTAGYAALPETPILMKNKEEGPAAAGAQKKLQWPGHRQWNVFVPHPSVVDQVDILVRKAVLESASISVYAINPNTADDASRMSLGFFYTLVRQTGGKLYCYPDFQLAIDYEKLYYDMYHELANGIALDVSFKLRVSSGLVVKRIKCPWSCLTSENGGYGNDVNVFSIPRLHWTDTVCFDLDYAVDELPGKCGYVQAAFTYTNWFGERCLRVMTKRYMYTSMFSSVFRMSDVESTLLSLVRHVCLGLMSGRQNVQEDVDHVVAEILLSYRLHAATNSPFGQLILPEALKLLPLYLTALFKSPCTRKMGDLSDARVEAMNLLNNQPLANVCRYIYPFLYPLHRSVVQLKGEELGRVGFHTDVQHQTWTFVFVPQTLPASGERVNSDGVYLLDDGTQFLLYLGQHVLDTVRRQICVRGYDMSATRTPLPPAAEATPLQAPNGAGGVDPNNMLIRIWNVVQQLRLQNNSGDFQPVRVILAGSVAESEFIWKMAEDRLSAEKGYVDYLVDMHRIVQKELADA
ncbi:putative Sec24-like protein [Gregarina niphandrodes]|uniref:Sec24-like protein n=1 Tax=Gregarina niphandrodes TaxID=110365 RepID=A0A023B3D5_GRENI|nr:putative Sec24-like protein [Gregarina niphandrodes]EZG55503.1 putative Sec24-like protein [Gregarina niphandrodes]|eukprot:XP_011131530.1 putative Sec24-like protein [Gregarina niphandrodes]